MFKRMKIELKKEDFFKDLDLVKKDMNKIARRMMGKVATEIKKDVRNKNLKGGVLNKRDGLLLKSLKHKTSSDLTGTISSNSPWASIHEQGAIILPKNGRYLTIKFDDEYRKVERVVIPQRQFLWPMIDEYFSTSKAEEIMDSILQKALDTIFSQ
jgi:phage gpG-like protein